MEDVTLSRTDKRRDEFLEFVPGEKSVTEVIREVAIKHGLTMTEMLGSQRPPHITRARQEAYYRCRKETMASLLLIGRYFGNRNHSTIRRGAEKHERQLAAQNSSR